MKLDGKVAIVTGAGSGIGREIALHFAREGAKIAVCDINMPGANETVDMVTKIGTKAIAVSMDVSNEDAENAGVEKTAAAFGTVDILVSNAGIQNVHPIEEFPFAD